MIALVRVPIAHVKGAVDEFAPLPFLGRVREVGAEGFEDQAEARYVWDTLFPGFDAIWELRSKTLGW